jgi:serine/threonine-protein kinase
MRRIGPYEILGLLGRGGMGAVYKARMPATGRIVAVKALKPTPFLVSLLGEKEIRRRFTAEAALLGPLEHPHLASVWGYGVSGGRPYFVMEYFCRDLGQVMGESADAEAPTRRLPLPDAARYALQTLSGLARLHHAGIVHRDVKPFNLLITGEDQIKIADFGLSKARGERAAAPPGLKVGSPFYAAPEQSEAPESAGPAADLYSLAVTLHRMLTGALPAWPLSGDALPHRLSLDLDRAWNDFFLRALSPDPGARHRDARSMAAELTVLLDLWRERVRRACRMEGAGPGGGGRGTDKEAAGVTLAPGTGGSLTRPQGEAGAAPPRVSGSNEPTAPRSEPGKFFGRDVAGRLGLDGLWRPLRYATPALSTEGPLVRDAATGLLWQAGGSPYPLDWREAHDFVEHLNATAYAGLTGWRLPTVPELSSILARAPEFTGHCLSPIFDHAQRLLWSADRRAFTQAWFADLGLGAFSFADLTCRRSVRAVHPAVRPSVRPE